jgi:putative transposase
MAASNKPLGQLIGAFKTVTTKRINHLRHTTEGLLWQRGYWDRVVRNAREMERARDYIRNNPANWATDLLNRDRGL